jgi:hypothetical protein
MENNYLNETEDIEKIFNSEIHEKKVIGRGIHNRAPRKSGFRRGVLFHADLLKGKEKKNYTKGGQVMEYNLYDSIIPFDEFEQLTTEKKKEVLERWADLGYGSGEVKAVWARQLWKYFDYRKKFGMVKETPRKGKVTKAEKEVVATKNTTPKAPVNSLPAIPNEYFAQLLQPKEPEQPKAFTFSFDKNFTGTELSKKLLNVASYFEKDDAEFHVVIKIYEVDNKEEKEA